LISTVADGNGGALDKTIYLSLTLEADGFYPTAETICPTAPGCISNRDWVLEKNILSKKLYVGNLSYEATESQVRDLLSEYGEIESIAMITDRDSGRFRGFCFVEMPDAAADAAIKALDGTDHDGRSLRVNEARPREERGGGRRGGGRQGGGYRGGGRDGGRKSSGRRDDYPDSGGGRRW
jgi:cold-inducible RNA-binding protein